MVIPKRRVERFKELSPDEITDLFQSTQKISVGKKILINSFRIR
jgi:diadenosine tetraphosphate (Ap4A) HIT family hydrolase